MRRTDTFVGLFALPLGFMLRARSFFRRLPVDLQVVDSMSFLAQQMRSDEKPIVVYQRKGFAETDRKIAWQGAGADEKGVDAKTGETLVQVDPLYYRPTEVDALLGDPTKARERLGWSHTVTFEGLVKEMVAEDLKQVQSERERRDRAEGWSIGSSSGRHRSKRFAEPHIDPRRQGQCRIVAALGSDHLEAHWQSVGPAKQG